MKYPEYDSPFELFISDITTQIARDIDAMSWQAVQKVGVNVDKEKLLMALRQDAERYREAYANGYDTGYEKRDDDIVRCKDCKHLFDGEHTENCCDVLMEKAGWLKEISVSPDWFCADGERKDDDA